MNFAQVNSNRFAEEGHGKGQNKRRGRANGGLMKGRKWVKAGSKVLGWPKKKE